MPIPVSCQCGQSFRAKDDLAGKRVKCPKCGQPLQVPGANSAGSASASGLLSIDDLMKMDAAAPAAPMQNMPMPGMQQGTPAGFPQAGGHVPPGMGGFQAPNPFFAQPGARPRSSSGDQGFKVAMLALGGVCALAVIAMVLIFVLRGSGSDNTNVASNTPVNTGPTNTTPNTTSGATPPGTTTPGTTTPGTTTPGTPTPGTTIPGTSGPGTKIPGTTNPGSTIPGTAAPGTTTPGTNVNSSGQQTFAHPGYDTAEAAVDGFLGAIQREDLKTVRDIVRDILGRSWRDAERALERKAKASNRVVDDLWREDIREAKDKLKRTESAQFLGNSRAFVPLALRLDIEGLKLSPDFFKTAFGAVCIRDAGGKWHMGMDDAHRDVLLAMFGGSSGGPATASGPSLVSGLKQYYGQQKELRGNWGAEEGDHPYKTWSWMTELLPYLGQDELYRKLDFKKTFLRDPNRSVAGTVIPQFLNPADNRKKIQEFSPFRGMAVTHFVGMSGVEDHRQVVAAALPRSDPRAGIFGYDHVASPAEITDGTSNTIMLIGVDMPRPWIEGGGATIRGAREPYFGAATGSQFGTRGQKGAITVMADGSVRLIPSSIDLKVFRDMCTIHGGEKVDMSPHPSKEDFFGGSGK